jgi:hypothetical protein
VNLDDPRADGQRSGRLKPLLTVLSLSRSELGRIDLTIAVAVDLTELGRIGQTAHHINLQGPGRQAAFVG